MSYDDLNTSVITVYSISLADANVEIAIIQRFHPVIVELKIPCVASGRHHLDDQRFARVELPVAVVIDDGVVASGGEGVRCGRCVG